ncbi:MAG: hypothetical protein LAT57_13000, partial [Balneolales bacterium]|nr:hypothetical protein [Balneolales bacterium]
MNTYLQIQYKHYIVFASLLWMLPVTSLAQFAGGNGTVNEPWQVATIEQLQAINNEDYFGDHFIQINDIDASETANWNDGEGFDPIGWDTNAETNFSGSYNGQSFHIRNLTINRPDSTYVGLFGLIREANLSNITLENVNITGKSVGGIAGQAWSSELTNIAVDGILYGDYVGGLFGVMHGSIMSKSIANVTIVGTEEAGGLVGFIENGFISESASYGELSGAKTAGGLVGKWIDIYENEYQISNSYSEMDVSGTENVGGLIGHTGSTIFSAGLAMHGVYASGSVQSDDIGGALVGHSQVCLLITAAYWDEKVGTDKAIGTQYEDSCLEGFMIAHIDDAQSIKKLTSVQMTGQNAWNTMHELDFNEVWQLTDEYPKLKWQDVDTAVENPDFNFPRQIGNVWVYEWQSNCRGEKACAVLRKELIDEIEVDGMSCSNFELNQASRTMTWCFEDNKIFWPRTDF